LALQKYPAIQGKETLPVIKIRELKQGVTENTDKANTELDKKYIINNGDILGGEYLGYGFLFEK
jgi:type I restriction enzyme S subunit